MKLLFVGDVVGEPGRKAVKKIVPRLREELGLDIVIANAENAAGGSGITKDTAADVFAGGVDLITMGDHLWDQKETGTLLHEEDRIVRPVNYPPGTPGQGSRILEKNGCSPIAVINAQGRTFMREMDNPFLAVEAEVSRLASRARILFVDFHAEATSEKIAMGRMLDGKVSAVVGTHTHVPTADEQIFPGGTAYLTDAGFTGGQHSILGRDIEPIITRFKTLRPQRFTVSKKEVRLHGVYIEIDDVSGHAKVIRRVAEALPSHPDGSAG